MVVTEPSVSTEFNRRVIAFRAAIFCTPNASVMAITAGRPSGMAATAKPMAERMSSSKGVWWTRPATTSMRIARNTHTIANADENFFIDRVSGVSTESTSASMVVMCPISVPAPVAVTTPVPLPVSTSVPENAMDVRSPIPASASTGSVPLTTASASPVSADSSMCRLVAASMRRSAGTLSPADSFTTSPTTSSAASILWKTPSRNAADSGESMLRIDANASAALPSWMNPTIMLMMTTAPITMVSVQCPRNAVSTAAAMRT